MLKTTLWGILVLCLTVLIFTLLAGSSLCELKVRFADVEMQAILAYETR
ncbi:MAG: Hok/Gef family protein [Enterobacteriaceae bacterium]